MENYKKPCIICKEEKQITEFYKHAKMSDGHLNKCKECTKSQSKDRHYEKYKDPQFAAKEKERSKERYYRLNYKERHKELIANKPWKKSAMLKNINKKHNIDSGYECHHWSYEEIHYESFFVISKKEHRRLHTYLELDINILKFKIKSSGFVLNTKEDHRDFIISLGIDIRKEIE